MTLAARPSNLFKSSRSRARLSSVQTSTAAFRIGIDSRGSSWSNWAAGGAAAIRSPSRSSSSAPLKVLIGSRVACLPALRRVFSTAADVFGRRRKRQEGDDERRQRGGAAGAVGLQTAGGRFRRYPRRRARRCGRSRADGQPSPPSRAPQRRPHRRPSAAAPRRGIRAPACRCCGDRPRWWRRRPGPAGCRRPPRSVADRRGAAVAFFRNASTLAIQTPSPCPGTR